MDDWTNVAAVDEVPTNGCMVTDLNGTEIAIFNIGGEYFAIEDRCSHDGAEIASGRVDDHQIVCPRHGARFCLRTGKALTPPAYEDLARFPVRVSDDGVIQVLDDR